ncbi:phenylalanine--tRNA ligase subunit beta [Candidatus Aerophobetes bacterium]|nr:phenylalanine--tRNA ligase subunit beta [Candidatus Aerophobetes bacterium]
MRVSFNQLKQMVDFPYTPGQLAEKLTSIGLEVREVESVGKLEGVVVGKVLEVKKHPNADRLKVVDVDLRGKILSFVCGAPNVEEGKYVAVALEGARLPGGVKVRRAKIRGVVSPGMICSEKELGLGEDHTGIMILPSHLSPGENLSNALSLEDTIFDLEVTSNRGDCLSVLGVAREISALTGKKVMFPGLAIEKGKLIFEENPAGIEIKDQELCPFYAARLIRGVKVTPSPLWLKWKIILYGGRPVNNVVDVTNYVMWEIGQPLHPFDFDTVKGSKIVVRRARDGEVLVTLDGKERILNEDMLVIADSRDSIALAGIMGGRDTEVTEKTRNILLEAAYFDPVCIGRTSRRLGLKSEASLRFEKGVDPAVIEKALDRACFLIQKLAGGKIVDPSLKAGKPPFRRIRIYFRPSKVSKIAGTRIPSSASERILKRLGFGVEKGEGKWVVSVPSFRQDIEREIDLVEEVCRIYGYDKVKVSLPGLGSGGGRESKEEKIKDLVRNLLKGWGFYETINSPLVGESLSWIADDSIANALALRNPLSNQQRFLRTFLFPRLIEVASFNYNQEVRNFRIMEIGKVFLKEGGKLKENSSLSGVVVEDNFNFYRLKGIVEAIFNQAGIEEMRFYSRRFPYFSWEESTAIKMGENDSGFLGKLHPEICEKLKLPYGQSYVFELNFDLIISLYREEKKFKPLPKFPSIRRDISIVIKEDIPAEKIRQYILRKAKYVEEVEFFDLYRGPHVPPEYKSLSFSLIFRHPQRTLTDEEVNLIQEGIVKSLSEKWGAYLRSR